MHFGDTIAGYAKLWPQPRAQLYYDGEIYELYLKPEFQGLGFGRRLFTAARRDLAQSGLKTLVIWALSDNDPAVEFYRALGGRAVARSSERFGTKVLDKVAFAGSRNNSICCDPFVPAKAGPSVLFTHSARSCWVPLARGRTGGIRFHKIEVRVVSADADRYLLVRIILAAFETARFLIGKLARCFVGAGLQRIDIADMTDAAGIEARHHQRAAGRFAVVALRVGLGARIPAQDGRRTHASCRSAAFPSATRHCPGRRC